MVTIRVLDDEGGELSASTGSAYTPFAELEDTPERAFAIALEHLDVDA